MKVDYYIYCSKMLQIKNKHYFKKLFPEPFIYTK